MNKYRLVIELPKSDGFHTRDDRHLAEIVRHEVAEVITGPTGITGCTIRIEES